VGAHNWDLVQLSNFFIMKQLLFLGLMMTLFCLACQEQGINVPEFVLPATDKVVLVEELTGVECSNCPAASAELGAILDRFEGLVVGYGIHGAGFTNPISGESNYLFRNQDNIELENSISYLGKPAATINRIQFEDEDYLAVDAYNLWQGLIEREFEKPSVVNIEMYTSYDEISRQLTIDIDVIPIATIEGNLYLTVTLNESHIIDAQNDNGIIIRDYEHNHVLREIMSNVEGDLIGLPVIQERISRKYTYTIPQEDGTWIASNMQLIAFVSNDATNPGEVLQARQRKYQDW